MVRWLMISCVACLGAGVFTALLPDPWQAASVKAAKDAEKVTQNANVTDQINWQLSQDPALLHVVVWARDGGLLYPPPTGMTPFPYELSEDTLNRLARIRASSVMAQWSQFDATTDKLLYCRAGPDLCLIYDRQQMVQALGLPIGALQRPSRKTPLTLVLLGCGVVAGALSVVLRMGQKRRQTAAAEATFRLVPERHVALRGNLEVPLTPRDLKLLTLLSDRSGDVVTKDELYDGAWGRDYMPNSRALDQHMITLRRKLDPDKSLPVLIETVRGVGYRLLL